MDQLKNLYNYLNLKKDKKILFLTTSNRWEGHDEMPKSSIIADELSKKLNNVSIIDVSKLKIFPCEGNVSNHEGNGCGIKKAMLQNKQKNPHNFIRCWCSINNSSDEMYKVANAIYEADIVIFFGSIRWGKMNSIYGQIIERLTWLENRHTTLGEDNLLKNKLAGIVAVGHNWNGKETIQLEKQVLKFFGFQVPDELSFNWQYTKNALDESAEGYKKDYPKFLENFNFSKILKEGLIRFTSWKEKI
jgi:multimeric flavodoxin WrbA